MTVHKETLALVTELQHRLRARSKEQALLHAVHLAMGSAEA